MAISFGEMLQEKYGIKPTRDEIQDALVNVGGVGIMKGQVYGSDKYLRLNCGCTLAKLKIGMERFKKSLDYLYR